MPRQSEKWLTSGSEVNHLVAARIRSLMASQSTAAFARKCGLGESLLRQYLAGSMPGADKAAQIARANGVTLDWLVLGDDSSSIAPRNRVEEPAAGYAYVPLLDVRASAGHGAVIDREHVTDLLAFREEWLRQVLDASPKDVVLLYVQGRSMEPDLRAGDVIMIDIRDTLAEREAIYVLRMDGALLVKELQRLPGGVIRVRSKNAEYDTFDKTVSDIAADDDFAIIGRVVWGCRRF